MNRRDFIQVLGLSAGSAALGVEGFKLRYLLSSCLYGTSPLQEILPEVAKTGATHLDLWPLKHGNQREQPAEMGDEKFAELLEKHGVKLGCITRYDLGPFKLAEELKWAQRFGCKTIVTGASGPKELAGDELRKAIERFVEDMKPHIARAEECGVCIAIENHGNGLMESPESLRLLAELSPSPALGIAFAPYHLPQDEPSLAALIRECGKHLAVFYAWQHGKGAVEKQPKEDELQQIPGRGPLDFAPLIGALREIGFDGWTSIFMHPFPRGVPIVEGGVNAVTNELNRARTYLDGLK